MVPPALSSFVVERFRAFRNLSIDRLGRVNLIVGKNNAGKSTLLEALWLYSTTAAPYAVADILGWRDERVSLAPGTETSVAAQVAALRYLFYGRPELEPTSPPIRIGPKGSLDNILSVSVRWYQVVTDKRGVGRLQIMGDGDVPLVGASMPRITVQLGDQAPISYSIDLHDQLPPNVLPIRFYTVYELANGLPPDELASLWDRVVLSSQQEAVIESLRMIAPGVQDLSFVQNFGRGITFVPLPHRVPIVKLQALEEPIPLRSLGDGMQRMLGIALTLVNAPGGIALIDEIENGLHYSTLQDTWALIFDIAARLNVQVFATTHSRECLEAFQRVSKENHETEGVLVRLARTGEDIKATLFSEEELEIATQDQLEVR